MNINKEIVDMLFDKYVTDIDGRIKLAETLVRSMIKVMSDIDKIHNIEYGRFVGDHSGLLATAYDLSCFSKRIIDKCSDSEKQLNVICDLTTTTQKLNSLLASCKLNQECTNTKRRQTNRH